MFGFLKKVFEHKETYWERRSRNLGIIFSHLEKVEQNLKDKNAYIERLEAEILELKSKKV
jgi:hypothetical protein